MDEERRRFLGCAGCAGLGLAMLGLSPERVSALPILFTEGVQSGAERRYPIPAGDSVNIDRSASLIVVRLAGRAYVFALSCPHENNALKWVQKEMKFHCTKHDSVYQPDGVHIEGRATRNMDRYVIHREGDDIVVDLHRWVQSDRDPAGWAAANIAV